MFIFLVVLIVRSALSQTTDSIVLLDTAIGSSLQFIESTSVAEKNTIIQSVADTPQSLQAAAREEVLHPAVQLQIAAETQKDTFKLSESIFHELDTTRASAEWRPHPREDFIREHSGNVIIRKSSARPRWFFGLFMIQLLSLIYLKITYFRRIEAYIKAYFNLNLSQQLLREQEAALSFQVLIMMFNFLLSCSLLVYLLFEYFFHPEHANSFLLFLQIFLGVAVIYAAKYFGYRFLEIVFPFSEEIVFFRFVYFMNQKLLGVMMIPFIYTALYGEPGIARVFLFVSVALFVFSVIIRSIKGLMIGAKFLSRNTFHFLIYICTFEIAPLLILTRWLHIITHGQS